MTQHQVVRSLETRLYVNGVWTEPQGGGCFGVEDPSTGESLASVADAGPEDGAAALEPLQAPRRRGRQPRPATWVSPEQSDHAS